MRAGGEDYFSRCLLVTLGMCCFPQWEKLIPLSGAGRGRSVQLSCLMLQARRSEVTKSLPFAACCFGFQVWGTWILPQTLVHLAMLPQLFPLRLLRPNTDPLCFPLQVFRRAGRLPRLAKLPAALLKVTTGPPLSLTRRTSTPSCSGLSTCRPALGPRCATSARMSSGKSAAPPEPETQTETH